MLGFVPVWSTAAFGDRDTDPWARVCHRMVDDLFGRPGPVVCGRSTEGLFFGRDLDWADVPVGQRCARCTAGTVPTPPASPRTPCGPSVGLTGGVEADVGAERPERGPHRVADLRPGESAEAAAEGGHGDARLGMGR